MGIQEQLQKSLNSVQQMDRLLRMEELVLVLIKCMVHVKVLMQPIYSMQHKNELNWNNLVIGGKLYFSGFNNRVAKSAGTYQFSQKTKDGQYTVNSVEIKCGIRELPERFYGHRAVDYINVAGYVDNGVVDLPPFGQINHCLVLYKDGPGFALAGVTWQRDDSNNKPGYDVAVERLLNVYQKHRNDLPDPDSP